MKTYCDAQGRPDPNGQYEIAPRRNTLKDGERVSFDLAFMDSAPATERTCADAYAAMVADLTRGGSHNPAPPRKAFVPDKAALDRATAEAETAHVLMREDLARASVR